MPLKTQYPDPLQIPITGMLTASLSEFKIDSFVPLLIVQVDEVSYMPVLQTSLIDIRLPRSSNKMI